MKYLNMFFKKEGLLSSKVVRASRRMRNTLKRRFGMEKEAWCQLKDNVGQEQVWLGMLVNEGQKVFGKKKWIVSHGSLPSHTRAAGADFSVKSTKRELGGTLWVHYTTGISITHTAEGKS